MKAQPSSNDYDISRITDFLFISAFPGERHAEDLLARNVRLILSMHWIPPGRTLRRPPLRVLWLPTIDSPLTPMPMWMLRRGVDEALPVIHAGHAVLAHCKAGVHRSVAMAASVLIAMGYSAEEAMAMIVDRRPVADPYVPYIRKRIQKFEAYWQKLQPRHGS